MIFPRLFKVAFLSRPSGLWWQHCAASAAFDVRLMKVGQYMPHAQERRA